MQVIYGGYGRPGGFCSLHYLANMMKRLLEAEVDDGGGHSGGRPYGEIIKGAFKSGGQGETPCLVLCRVPTDLKLLFEVPNWRRRFGVTVAWVIDSFIWEAIPRSIKLLHPYDHIFVAGLQDVEETRRRTGIPTSWLPIGTDALDLGDAGGDRPIDVIRIGRQPPEWEDDPVSEAACRRRGLNFHGRPPVIRDPQENQIAMHRHCAQSKFCLAFSNTIAPASYTHKTRAYITPRWLDAIASGATVAGARPDAPGVDALLWPGATLELGGLERERGLNVLTEAVRAWSPEQARHNRLMALKRLDWRWRLWEIAQRLDLAAPRLQLELNDLRQTIAEDSAPRGVVSEVNAAQ